MWKRHIRQVMTMLREDKFRHIPNVFPKVHHGICLLDRIVMTADMIRTAPRNKQRHIGIPKAIHKMPVCSLCLALKPAIGQGLSTTSLPPGNQVGHLQLIQQGTDIPYNLRIKLLNKTRYGQLYFQTGIFFRFKLV